MLLHKQRLGFYAMRECNIRSTSNSSPFFLWWLFFFKVICFFLHFSNNFCLFLFLFTAIEWMKEKKIKRNISPLMVVISLSDWNDRIYQWMQRVVRHIRWYTFSTQVNSNRLKIVLIDLRFFIQFECVCFWFGIEWLDRRMSAHSSFIQYPKLLIAIFRHNKCDNDEANNNIQPYKSVWCTFFLAKCNLN